MTNQCPLSSDVYFDYLHAARLVATELAKAQASLGGLPSLGARAAQTTFQSPAGNRLREELADIGSSLTDAEGRLRELIAFLRMLTDKYDVEYRAALAHEAKMAEASKP